MPCYDPPISDAEQIARYEREARHNSPLAEMLCETIKLLQSHQPKVDLRDLSPAVIEWWAEHQERDKRKQNGRT